MLRKLITKCLERCFIIFVNVKNLHDDEGYIDSVTIWIKYPKFSKVLQRYGLMSKDKDFRYMLRIDFTEFDTVMRDLRVGGYDYE